MRVAKSIFSVRTTLAKYLFISLCGITLLLICADAELNHGPKKSESCCNFSLCHWNLNSITAHNFSKILLIEAYNVQHKFGMICISETYLDSSFPMNPDFSYQVITHCSLGNVPLFKGMLLIRSFYSKKKRLCGLFIQIT